MRGGRRGDGVGRRRREGFFLLSAEKVEEGGLHFGAGRSLPLPPSCVLSSDRSSGPKIEGSSFFGAEDRRLKMGVFVPKDRRRGMGSSFFVAED